MLPSPRSLWSPPEPSITSNAEASSQIVANGFACQKTNKHGNSGSDTGPLRSMNNDTSRIRMGEQMVASLYNLANAAVQKNDTVEKLVM